MKSFLFAVVFGILLALFGVAVCSADGITSEDQVKALIDSGKLDAPAWIYGVYTATPEVTMPGLHIFLTDKDAAVSLDGPVVVSVDGKLRYNLTMGPWRFPGVVPHVDPWRLLEWGAGGFAVGVASTFLVLLISGHVK
jgi:hypothetical protein